MRVLCGLFAYINDKWKCHGQLKGVEEPQKNKKTLVNAVLELFRYPSVFALTDMRWRECAQ